MFIFSLLDIIQILGIMGTCWVCYLAGWHSGANGVLAWLIEEGKIDADDFLEK